MGLQRDEELLVASRDEPSRFVELYDRTLPGLLAFFVRRTLEIEGRIDDRIIGSDILGFCHQ